MNFWQGLTIGFLIGGLYVIYVLPWLQKKLR